MSTETTPKHSNDEVDLLQVLKLIGDGIKSVFRFIYNLFQNLAILLLHLLIFLKKNALYFIGAVVLALLANYLIEINKVPVYQGEAIVEPNFQTELEIRSRIDQYNLMIANQDSVSLANALNLEVPQAADIVGIEINPVYSLNKLRYDYYDYIYERDSTLYKKFTFDTYIENQRFEDYPEYTISVYSLDQNLYKDLNQTIWNFENDENIKKRQRFLTETYRVNRDYLENTLKSIDSTRATLRQVMINEANRSNSASTQIDLGNKATYSERPELYNYEKELRLELMQVIRAIEGTTDIVNVTKGFPKSGKVVLDSQRKYLVLGAVALTFLILLGLKFFRYIQRKEKENIEFKSL